MITGKKLFKYQEEPFITLWPKRFGVGTVNLN